MIQRYQTTGNHLLGQWWVLQFWIPVGDPEHAAPPYWGAGFVHDLVRPCVPPPHVTVHVSQLLHVVYPPSTETVSSFFIYDFTISEWITPECNWSIARDTKNEITIIR